MDDKISEINSKHYTTAYVDACPSELIQNSTESFLCVGLTTFSHLNRKNLKPISQYKKTRGLKRKLQIQDYLIQKIKDEEILLTGVVCWNYQLTALKNGLLILNEAGLLTDENLTTEEISISDLNVKLGICISLSWYSVVISMFFKYLSQIAKIQKKKKVAIFLDLLPGDNLNSQKKFEIVEYLINNSRLSEFQTDAMTENNLEVIGYGYGMLEKSLRDFKNDYEFVITDWIISSFYSLVKYQQGNLNINSDEYQLSKLARFLLDEEIFTIRKPFKLVPE